MADYRYTVRLVPVWRLTAPLLRKLATELAGDAAEDSVWLQQHANDAEGHANDVDDGRVVATIARLEADLLLRVATRLERIPWEQDREPPTIRCLHDNVIETGVAEILGRWGYGALNELEPTTRS